MRYLALINVLPEKTKEVGDHIRTFLHESVGGIKILGIYGCFGKYDLTLWFDAPDEKVAMDFIVEKVRGLPGVTYTETLLTREIVV